MIESILRLLPRSVQAREVRFSIEADGILGPSTLRLALHSTSLRWQQEHQGAEHEDTPECFSNTPS